MDNLHPGAEVAYASRSGKKGDGFIISLRTHVKGFKIKVGDIKKHIKKTFGNNLPQELDVEVYKSPEQLLGVHHGYKFDEQDGDDKTDLRKLEPLTHQDEKRAFLCQYFYGDEVLIAYDEKDFPFPETQGEKIKRSKSESEQTCTDQGGKQDMQVANGVLTHSLLQSSFIAQQWES
ncbi:hypothetical protein BDK51DRAFT_28126 [Blyttiomyces helicus]|uniref:Uncharacterized protein n=1 Tax=Blyttiomyces helicus TaxID=388810 RepID=A0A4P9WDY7_9FUNG|nr:hypothetical protein BDK51DRAFT_28126 [Blyttiomyces helicus]|eukprot:RKO89893.1 hypothetical protein BDK51DRAFT_28126 [Blyttiomyces helicus]